MKEEIWDRLDLLRQCMREENMDAYLILCSDFHTSEYISNYFKCLEYISGFTGSAGELLVLRDNAELWTDGRYFLQAELELAESGIQLQKKGEPGVKTIEQYLVNNLEENSYVGIDGRTISVEDFRKLDQSLKKKNISVLLDYDLVSKIWKNRPKKPCEPVWELDLKYTGKSRQKKILEIRNQLKGKDADCTIISSLEDVAWVLNIRGGDITYTPVPLGFLFISMEQVIWFVQIEAVPIELAKKLELDGIHLHAYEEVYLFFSSEINKRTIYLDPGKTNRLLYQKIKQHMKIVEGRNLTLLAKAIKNPIEIKNEYFAHIQDAVANTKLIYWLKKQIRCKKITEISVAKKLEKLRQEQRHYLGSSFATIVGYAHHGAIVHYTPSEKTDIQLKPENFVLIDSGGHYLEGTTDITRTIALGDLTQEQKYYYTLVLKGHIRIANAKFKYGCAGIHLDYLAREALWEEGLDYNHGTGHGVGYLLGVHEPPNSFRNRITDSKDECTKLEAGMITSDEPGLYLKGKYGIRIENLLLCYETEKNDYGQFMAFDSLTLVPYEREAILVEELTQKERSWINEYHNKILTEIGKYMNHEELLWLKQVTSSL